MRFRVLHYKTLDSTNRAAREFAEGGAEQGTTVVAEYQTHGRGRFNRKWHSPRGKGLLFSIVLRPNWSMAAAPIVTHIAAQSVRDVLQDVCGLNAKLKRPNDVLVGSKKIAGILTESTGAKRKISYVVVGIGLNVNTGSKDLVSGATSIYRESGKKYTLQPILEKILVMFRKRYLALA